MNHAKSLGQALMADAAPKPLRVRLPAQRLVPPERLHWALRVSFQALFSPHTWFRTQDSQH